MQHLKRYLSLKREGHIGGPLFFLLHHECLFLTFCEVNVNMIGPVNDMLLTWHESYCMLESSHLLLLNNSLVTYYDSSII